MSEARDLVKAERCSLFLVDSKTDGIFFFKLLLILLCFMFRLFQNFLELWTPIADGPKDIRFPKDRGIAGSVILTGMFIFVIFKMKINRKRKKNTEKPLKKKKKTK